MYYIVIPTYKKHFNYNLNFLESFDKFCIDKKKVIINFILTTYDIEEFNNYISKFNNINIKLYTLSELVYNVVSIKIDDNPNNFLTKYSLQSIKKLFAYTITNNNDYIVIDSENLCIKKFYMENIFKDLKIKPIFYSKIIKDIQIKVVEDCNNILNIQNNINFWFFLKSYWFFEYEIVNELIIYLKNNSNNIFDLLQNKIFFEYQLYSTFIFCNKSKEFILIDEKINNEIENFENDNYEYLCVKLNNNNIEKYCNFVNKFNEKILRLHWMDNGIEKNIINNTNICIGTYHWD